jgi:hypothetical protein
LIEREKNDSLQQEYFQKNNVLKASSEILELLTKAEFDQVVIDQEKQLQELINTVGNQTKLFVREE